PAEFSQRQPALLPAAQARDGALEFPLGATRQLLAIGPTWLLAAEPKLFQPTEHGLLFTAPITGFDHPPLHALPLDFRLAAGWADVVGAEQPPPETVALAARHAFGDIRHRRGFDRRTVDVVGNRGGAVAAGRVRIDGGDRCRRHGHSLRGFEGRIDVR